jgi:hypothetical protein
MSQTEAYCHRCLEIGSKKSSLFNKQRPHNRQGISEYWMRKVDAKDVGEPNSGPFVLPLERSFSTVQTSATTGCGFCRFLVESVVEFLGSEGRPPGSGLLFLVRRTDDVGDGDSIYVGGPPPEMTPNRKNWLGDTVCLYEGESPLCRFNLCVEGKKYAYDFLSQVVVVVSNTLAASCRPKVIARHLDHPPAHPGLSGPSAVHLMDLGAHRRLPP